jgi:alpha-1,3-rhamnosyl/mannosyltransferase
LYHEPNYIAPALDCPLVVTVHDLSHLRFPQYHPAARVRWLERFLPQTLARAAKILTVSEFARQEILEVFGLPPAKVVAIPLGLEAHFRPPAALELKQTLRRYGLVPQGYIASVGTLEPRKNLLRLVEAYFSLPARLRQRFPLVLIGPKGWHIQKLWPKMEQLMRRGEVRWLGYVEEAALPCLYAGAAVFAYLSLYEGFGLPVLEAMGCGAPVLTSKDSAMATWAGEAALLVDPLDVQAIGERLVQLLEDRELAQALATRGWVLARQFSWQRCADETLGVYFETING